MEQHGPRSLSFRDRSDESAFRHHPSKTTRKRQVGIDRNEQAGKPVKGSGAVTKNARQIVRAEPLTIKPLFSAGQMLVQESRAQSATRLIEMCPRVRHAMTQAVAKVAGQLVEPLALRSQQHVWRRHEPGLHLQPFAGLRWRVL